MAVALMWQSLHCLQWSQYVGTLLFCKTMICAISVNFCSIYSLCVDQLWSDMSFQFLHICISSHVGAVCAISSFTYVSPPVFLPRSLFGLSSRIDGELPSSTVGNSCFQVTWSDTAFPEVPLTSLKQTTGLPARREPKAGSL